MKNWLPFVLAPLLAIDRIPAPVSATNNRIWLYSKYRTANSKKTFSVVAHSLAQGLQNVGHCEVGLQELDGWIPCDITKVSIGNSAFNPMVTQLSRQLLSLQLKHRYILILNKH